MAVRLQRDTPKDVPKYYIAPENRRRGRMQSLALDETDWALARLQQRVSFSGWFFAMVCGLWLWALMFRLVM